MAAFLDTRQPSLWVSAASIVFNPLFWNVAARQEYHHRTISRLFGGDARRGCYALAVTIFTLGLVRDYLFSRALSAQPSAAALEAHGTAVRGAAAALFAAGTTLVLTSMWALGVTGTYLGDYFGILMAAPVTTFPFSVSRAPMYHGSVLSFVATALWHAKPAGLVLAGLVALCYEVACAWEDPFTAEIYAKRDRDAAAAKKAE